ncbi:T9SS type A sorting domain-containing protein [Crocinitomix catalasitica]|uniref:T9SS type A sorting domain-containing protein n=1 Tax=Crocinitomix catalasitica TaxID=184607 RepID=UPI000480E430|nr:Omp28-related outer membrane protein [Crocinitomix catalasitica]
MKKILQFLSIFVGATAFGQLPVSTEPGNKQVVLEEFTGIYCVFCPDGHKIGGEIEEANPGEVFLINLHTGYYANPSGADPDFRTSFGSSYAGISGADSYPSGSINRRVFVGSDFAMSRGAWAAAADEVLTEESYVNIAAERTIDPVTRELTVDVEAHFTREGIPETVSIYVAVVEDFIDGPQTGGRDFNPDQVNDDGSYTHMHMLRNMISGRWGDDIDGATVGTNVARTYTWDVPETLKDIPVRLGALRVIVFIAEEKENIIAAAQAAALNTVGVDNEEINDFSVITYPNPTADLINVQLELNEAAVVSYEIVDMLGAVVSTETSTNLNAGTHTKQIDLSDVANGMYFVKTTINDKIEMTKIQVQK